MKKRDLIVMLTALGAATIATPAAAQSKGFEPGFYIGAGLGQSFSSGGNTSGVVAGTTFVTSGLDDNQTSWQINGGYQFTPEWGIEVQYTDLGSRSGTITFSGALTGVATIADTDASQWGIAGTGTLWFNENWFGRGKLGVSFNKLDSTTVTFGGTVFGTNSQSKTDLLAGIGVGYKWNQNFSTRLEYEYFGKFGDNGNGNIKGNNLGLRMQYNF